MFHEKQFYMYVL